MENYQKKAEENLVELQKQKEQANKMKRIVPYFLKYYKVEIKLK